MSLFRVFIAAAFAALAAGKLAAQQTPSRRITFDDAIGIALKQNISVKQAENAASLSDAAVQQQKAQLLRLLDVSSKAEGVRIFIGVESQVVPFDDLSIVSANYEVDGEVVGTLGVIGPTRMPYDRMIQIVDITSKLVSNALSHRK